MDIIALHDFVFLFGTLSLLNMNVWYFRLLQFFVMLSYFACVNFTFLLVLEVILFYKS